MKIAIICLCLLVSGCATAPLNDPYVVRAFNDRISKVEEALKVNDKKPVERSNEHLTESQKEFMLIMMDYLSGSD